MSAAGNSYGNLLVDIDGAVATLTINRPEVLNAVSAATTRELGAAIEAHLFGLCFSTEDQSEGRRAFLEKRKAEWKGR